MVSSYTVVIEPDDGVDDHSELVGYLAKNTPLTQGEAKSKVDSGRVVVRNRTADSARTVARDVDAGFEATAEIEWTTPDGERVSVRQFDRIKGTVTGGAPPEDATLIAAVEAGPDVASTELFEDNTYDLHYPRIERPEFVLVVRLRGPDGGTLARADPIPDPESVEIVDLEISRGDPEPVTGGDDLFRFAVVKPSAGLERPDLVSASSSTDPHLMQTLVAERSDGNRLGMARKATEFADSDRFVTDLESLSVPLADFESALDGVNSLADLRAAVERVFDSSAEAVVDSDEFQEARERIASSLTAAAVDLNDRDEQVERLGDGLRMLSLIEDAADCDEALDAHGAVDRALDRPVVLPDELFPLPPMRTERPPTQQDGEPTRAVSLAKELARVRTASEELIASAVTEDDEARVHEAPDEFPQPEDVDRNGYDEFLDGDVRDGTDDEGDDDLAGDGGTSEFVSEGVAETFESLGITDPFEDLDDSLTVLNERQRQLGEDLQYELLDGDAASGPHSTVSLLGQSIDGETEPLAGSFDVDVVDQYPSRPHVNPLGVADLQVMRKTLDRYEMGEIAHIENVLEGESRKRTHRTLERSEEFVGTETDRVKEKKKSLETAERFEMETETKQTIEQEKEIDTGVEVSASYGPTVEVDAHFNYNQRTAKKESQRTSQRFAREVTERTVDRIKERVKRKEWEKTIEETEETNVHEIDNSGPDDDDHVIGIYRWLDKYYDAQVFNYGKRMLLEFIVPEPAAFYRYSRGTDAAEQVDMERPEPPRINEAALDVMSEPGNPDFDSRGDVEKITEGDLRPLRPSDIHGWNYTYYAQRYGAKVSPPPKKYQIASKNLSVEGGKRSKFYKTESIPVPEGYIGIQARPNVPRWESLNKDPPDAFINVDIGKVSFHAGRKGNIVNGDFLDKWKKLTQSFKDRGARYWQDELWNETVPVSIYVEARNSGGFAIDLSVLCRRTPQNYDSWQLETYKSIVQAYQNKRSEYEERVAAQRMQDGVEISGQNPERNREIERTELKRSMIAMLKDKVLYPDAIDDDLSVSGVPELDIETIEDNADTLRFLEQAFEWQNMTYRFYPYFWAKEAKWAPLSRLEDSDPKFASFLRAGAARVVLPVRPGYTLDVPHFMRKGKPPSETRQPNVGEEEYLSMIEDLKEQQNKLPEEATSVGDPWKVKQPTSLVKLQQGGSLSGDGSDGG